MGKHTNTYKSKKIKSKTIKSKKKNKKLLKMLNSESELDDINSLIDDDSILEENIQILIGGGDNDFIEPTELDKLLGYKGPIDNRSLVKKISDYINIDKAGDYFNSFISIINGLIARKVLSISGIEGKEPKEIANMLEKDSKALEQINDYLQTDKGKEMLGEIKESLNTATDVVGEAIKEIPNKVDESMNKVTDNAVQAGIRAMGGLPVIGTVIAVDKVAEKITETAGQIAEATGEISELVGDTADKLKQPIDDVKKKVDEISSNIENIQQQEQIKQQEQPEKQQEQIKQPEQQIKQSEQQEKQPEQQENQEKQPEKQQEQIKQLEQQEKQQEQIKQPEKISKNKIIQNGGSDIIKFHNILQNGGKKIRKRINNTRNSFKNIRNNIT